MSQPLDQLYVTHCTWGTSYEEQNTSPQRRDTVFEYDTRAASFDRKRGHEVFRQIERLMYYQLFGDRPGRDATTEERREFVLSRTWENTPVRFAWYPDERGTGVLCHVSYRDRDTSPNGGRPESYFAHVVLDDHKERGTRRITAREALQLWGSRHWVRVDGDFEDPHLPELKTLETLREGQETTIDDDRLLRFLTANDFRDGADEQQGGIPERWAAVSPERRQHLLRQLIAATLELKIDRQESLVLGIEPEVAALLFYGVARMLPSSGIGTRLGFSTYESHRQSCQYAPLLATSFRDPSDAGNDPGQIRHAKPGLTLNTFVSDDMTLPGLSETGPATEYARALLDLFLTDPSQGTAVDHLLNRLDGQGRTDTAEQLLEEKETLELADWLSGREQHAPSLSNIVKRRPKAAKLLLLELSALQTDEAWTNELEADSERLEELVRTVDSTSAPDADLVTSLATLCNPLVVERLTWTEPVTNSSVRELVAATHIRQHGSLPGDLAKLWNAESRAPLTWPQLLPLLGRDRLFPMFADRLQHATTTNEINNTLGFLLATEDPRDAKIAGDLLAEELVEDDLLHQAMMETNRKGKEDFWPGLLGKHVRSNEQLQRISREIADRAFDEEQHFPRRVILMKATGPAAPKFAKVAESYEALKDVREEYDKHLGEKPGLLARKSHQETTERLREQYAQRFRDLVLAWNKIRSEHSERKIDRKQVFAFLGLPHDEELWTAVKNVFRPKKTQHGVQTSDVQETQPAPDPRRSQVSNGEGIKNVLLNPYLILSAFGLFVLVGGAFALRWMLADRDAVGNSAQVADDNSPDTETQTANFGQPVRNSQPEPKPSVVQRDPEPSNTPNLDPFAKITLTMERADEVGVQRVSGGKDAPTCFYYPGDLQQNLRLTVSNVEGEELFAWVFKRPSKESHSWQSSQLPLVNLQSEWLGDATDGNRRTGTTVVEIRFGAKPKDRRPLIVIGGQSGSTMRALGVVVPWELSSATLDFDSATLTFKTEREQLPFPRELVHLSEAVFIAELANGESFRATPRQTPGHPNIDSPPQRLMLGSVSSENQTAPRDSQVRELRFAWNPELSNDDEQTITIPLLLATNQAPKTTTDGPSGQNDRPSKNDGQQNLPPENKPSDPEGNQPPNDTPDPMTTPTPSGPESEREASAESPQPPEPGTPATAVPEPNADTP